MKQIFTFDKQGYFTGDDFIEPDDKGNYTLPNNAIYVQPVGLHRPKLNAAKDGWVEGLSKAQALQNAQEAKVVEINQSCGVSIVGGFVSLALGTKHIYDSALEDQLNLVGAAGAGINLQYSCTDIGTGVKAEVLHTAAQMKQVYADGIAFKQSQLSKCRQLKAQIQSAATVAAVNKIKW